MHFFGIRAACSRWNFTLPFYLRVLSAFAAGAVLCCAQTANSPSLGIFDQQADVGSVLHPGSGTFNADARTYTLTGSGENIWSTADHFHFVWKKLDSKNITLSAGIELAAQPEPHRKAVIMIRQSLDPSAPYVDVAVHGSGLTSLQFRDVQGAPTHEIESVVNAPKRVRLARRGERFYFWVENPQGKMQFAGGSIRVAMHGDVYVGIGVCAHTPDVVQQATFQDVDLSTEPGGGTPVHYSTVQTIAVASTDSKAVYVSSDHLKTPDWSSDGQQILFLEGDKELAVSLDGFNTAASTAEMPESYGQERTPDGRYIYVVSNRSGSMQIWRSEPNGSGNVQVTNLNENCAAIHLSPDGKQIVFFTYAAGRPIPPLEADITVRLLSLADNSLRTIAKILGGSDSFGAQPWSPDSKQLTYVSYQSIEP